MATICAAARWRRIRRSCARCSAPRPSAARRCSASATASSARPRPACCPARCCRNRSLAFTCNDVHLRVENNQTIFTCGYAGRPDDPGAGRPSRRQLHRRPGDARPAGRSRPRRLPLLRPAGDLSDADNVNGSARAIAGIFNDSRTILGLMPHPENATDPLLGGTDGEAFFDGLVGALAVTLSSGPPASVPGICAAGRRRSFPPMTMDNRQQRHSPSSPPSMGLSAEEFERAVAILGRTPNLTELGIFSAMWSEHCSYKSSKVWLADAADHRTAGDLRPGRECRGRRYRRRRRRRLQDREPQPPLVHRALPGRGDRGRRHPARRLHDGRAADRDAELAALRQP